MKVTSAHNEPSEPNSYIFNGDRYWKISSDDINSNSKFCNRTVEPNSVGLGTRWQEDFLKNVDEGFKLPDGFWPTIFFKVRKCINDINLKGIHSCEFFFV